MRQAPSTQESSPTVAAVEGFLRNRYAIAGSVEPLSGENRNYRVERGGERLVLKIAAQGQSLADFEVEHAAVEHLLARNLGLGLPRSVVATDGAAVTEFQAGRPARLMRWVRGQPWLERPDPTPQHLEAAGRWAARVSLAFADFDPPGGRRRHRWAVSDAASQQAAVVRIADASRRRLVLDAFQCFAAHTHGVLDGLPRGWIHGDVNDENLLLEDDAVVGLIDFGDALVDPLVCELAIALSYLMMRRSEPLADGARVVAGYQSVRPLESEERRVLFPLVCGRLAMSLAVAARRRDAGSGHAPYFVSEAPAWELLERLAAVGPEAARRTLCGENAQPEIASERLLGARRRHVGPALSIADAAPQGVERRGGAKQLESDRPPDHHQVKKHVHTTI
jgi:Ser/Thr protein kinase RdoA (MazF antagonist)